MPDHRALAGLLAGVALLAGCGTAALLRPAGDGGWSRERRSAEIERRLRPGDTAGTPRKRIGRAEARGASPVPAGTLDLATAIGEALRNNRRIGAARQRVRVAEARVGDVRGRLLPATSGSGRYTWYTDEQKNQIDLPPGAFPGGAPPSVTIRESEVGVLNATTLLPIDLSGELRHALRAAQAGYRGEAARLWATTLEEELRVVGAYFRVLEARRIREVAEATVGFYGRQATNAESRFRAGRITKNDLLVIEVALRDAEQDVRSRTLDADRACWELNDLIGRPIGDPCVLADVTARPSLPAVDEALRVARERNPLVQALLEEEQRLEETARSLESERFPRFNAGAAIDYSSSDLVEPRDVGSGFTGFTWDIGTDGRREARIASARSEVVENRIRLEQQLRALETGIRAARGAAEERLAAFDAAAAAVSQADENLRIRQQQFDAGRATSDDVLEAETRLARQRATLAGALYQAHTRQAELRSLMGVGLARAER